MRKPRGLSEMDRRHLLRAACASLVASQASVAWATGRNNGLVLIVSNHSPMQEIQLGDLRRVFSGEPVNHDKGGKLIPLNHPVMTPDRVTFDRVLLTMNPEQISKYWIDRKIRGQSGPPRTVSSLSILLGVVSRLPGAIGYVSPLYLNGEVRTLSISGARPGSPEYPL